MTDIFNSEKRSKIMAAVRSKNTKPEEVVRKYLFSKGFRYRKNDKRYPGTPDIVLPKYKTIIFINGCFWHHHGCKKSMIPKSRSEFWEIKFKKNVARDSENVRKLKDLGWRVITIWECEISKKTDRDLRLQKLCDEIKNSTADYNGFVN